MRDMAGADNAHASRCVHKCRELGLEFPQGQMTLPERAYGALRLRQPASSSHLKQSYRRRTTWEVLRHRAYRIDFSGNSIFTPSSSGI